MSEIQNLEMSRGPRDHEATASWPPQGASPADVSRPTPAAAVPAPFPAPATAAPAGHEEPGTTNEELPPMNPLFHSSTTPLPLSALAAILGCTRSTIRHFADKLGFRYTVRRVGPRHKRTACLTPAQANAIAAEVARDAAPLSPSPSLPISPSLSLPVSPSSATGHFYLLQLEPQHDPGRFKLGFSTDVESRLDDLRTVVPLARLIAAWPCHRSWERIAIVATAQNAEPLSQEVFRCTHLEEAVAAADRFFAVMPKLAPSALPLHLHLPNPAEPEPNGHPRIRAHFEWRSAFAPACSTALGGAEAPPSPNLRCGKVAAGAEPNVAALHILENLGNSQAPDGGSVAPTDFQPNRAQHQINPSPPPTTAPPPPEAHYPSASPPLQGREAAPPASQTSRCGKAAGGAEQTVPPHQNLTPQPQTAADIRGAPKHHTLLPLPPAYAHLVART